MGRGCRPGSGVLLLFLLHSSQLHIAAARAMIRAPSAEAPVPVLSAVPLAPAAAKPAEQRRTPAPPAAATDPDLPVSEDAAIKVAQSTITISSSAAAQRARAAAQQSRAAAQGKTLRPTVARNPPTTPAVPRAPTTSAAAAVAAASRKQAAASKAAAAATAAVSGMASSAVKEGANRAAAKARSHVLEGLPALTPLSLLLGDAKYSNPQLSTDGRYLAYIKPDAKNGVSNVFVRKLPQPAAGRDPDAERVDSDMAIFEREGTANDKQITFDTKQGVSAYSWSEDSTGVVFIQDHDGDENYHLYIASVTNPGDAIDLTPFPGVKAQDIVSSELFPSKLFIGLNRRDPAVFDMYSLDLGSLTLSLHMVNPGQVSSWLLDYDFNVRGAECYNNTNGATYVLINDALPFITKQRIAQQDARLAAVKSARRAPKTLPERANTKPLEEMFARAKREKWGLKEWGAASSSKADMAKWRRLITWPFGEEGGVFKFNREGNAVHMLTSIDRDTTEFQLVSTAPGAKVLERIASHPLSNINSVEFNPHTWEPQMVSFNYLKIEWTVLDPHLKEEWGRIEAFRPGEEVAIIDRSVDEKTWILSYTSDSPNTKYYIHRVGSWPPELLFDTQPGLAPYSVAKTHPVVIPARDGLKLPSYLTLPVKKSIPATLPACVAGAVPKLAGEGRLDADAQRSDAAAANRCPMRLNLPLVLSVHGGPWSRDSWGADPVVQLLTNRGYAVLQVNYRASSGYGKRFMNLGDKQWSVGTMQHDLTDSVRWAIEKGIADPKRVCIMGGSYGGYATLAGLAFTPELYACGIDLVGISNVATFMRSIPPYWEPLRYEWTTRVGPADTDEPFNRRISPMYHVDKIRAPLLIAQGAHDPRVPQAESDQMFRAMFTRKRPVQYVLYTDEGHGISKPDNRQDYYSRVEHFLAKYLGGRAEAPPKLKGVSAIEVKDLTDLAAVADTAAKQKGKVPVALIDTKGKRSKGGADLG